MKPTKMTHKQKPESYDGVLSYLPDESNGLSPPAAGPPFPLAHHPPRVEPSEQGPGPGGIGGHHQHRHAAVGAAHDQSEVEKDMKSWLFYSCVIVAYVLNRKYWESQRGKKG